MTHPQCDEQTVIQQHGSVFDASVNDFVESKRRAFAACLLTWIQRCSDLTDV